MPITVLRQKFMLVGSEFSNDTSVANIWSKPGVKIRLILNHNIFSCWNIVKWLNDYRSEVWMYWLWKFPSLTIKIPRIFLLQIKFGKYLGNEAIGIGKRTIFDNGISKIIYWYVYNGNQTYDLRQALNNHIRTIT